MAFGPFSANRIEFGLEGTVGTAKTPTVVWAGPAIDIQDTSTVVFVQEDTGTVGPSERSYVPFQGAMVAFPETEVTFQQGWYPFQTAMGSVAAGAGTVTRSYIAPYGTALPTLQTATIRTGNAIVGDGGQMAGAFCSEWEVSGSGTDAVKITSTWLGQKRTSQALVGTAITIPSALEAALNAKTTLYSDPSGGTVGTTQVPGVLRSWSIKGKSPWVFVPIGDGNTYPTIYKFAPSDDDTYSASMTFELENNTGGTAVSNHRTYFAEQTKRLYRIKVPGSTPNEMRFDFVGKPEAVGAYQRDGGNTLVTVDFKIRPSVADSLYFTATFINLVTTNP